MNRQHAASPVAQTLLSGVVVIEVAHALTEYAGVELAGLGAEVWLVEPPGGSPTRARGPHIAGVDNGRSGVPFLARNVGKCSVAVRRDDPDDAALLVGLLARADVVIAFQDDRLLQQAEAAGVPTVTITDPDGLGTSPIVGYAASGSLSSTGWPHQPPCNAPSWPALDAVGTFAAACAALAVRQFRRDASVHHFRVHYKEASIAALTNWTRSLHSYGMVSAGQGAATERQGSGPFPVFPCADGYVRVIAATPHHWASLLEVLGNPELLCEPSWSTFQFRSENFDVIHMIATEALRTRKADDVFRQGQALGLPITPVLTLQEVLSDEHLAARQMFTSVDDPDHGRVRLLRPPLRVGPAGNLQPTKAIGVAPALDEHRAQLVAAVSTAAPRARPPRRAAAERSALPLAGLRVLSFAVGAAIPEASSALAALGADVVKIESAAGLDFFRKLAGETAGNINDSPILNQVNLGVRSCAIDASTERGRLLLRQLVSQCDVLMENMRAPIMRKFGLDEATVRTLNPAIIYLSSQGFGEGPYEEYQTLGPNLQSFAGMTSIWAHPDDPYPVGSTSSFPDNFAGKQALAAVFAALLQRDATGQGCRIDAPQIEIGLWAIADKLLQQQLIPGSVTAAGNHNLDAAPHGCYPCRGDDQWCAVSVDDDAMWVRLVGLLGESKIEQPRFATLTERLADRELIDAAVAGWTRQRSPAEAVAALRAAGISASILVDGASQAADREMHDSGFYFASAHPVVGVRWHTALPFLLDGERLPIRRAPLMGEHTEDVLFGRLGLSAHEVSDLVSAGAAGT